MAFLISSLRSKDKSEAFTTIGLIALAVKGNIKPYLGKIMDVCKAALPAKVRT
jgi:hypothetical protein